jgi:bis(5'-nucleosyl)-tetraphosphatase (symmetrical)
MGDFFKPCPSRAKAGFKKSPKTLRYLQSNNIKPVLGNHEDKLIRYLDHQKKDKNNPIILDKDAKDIGMISKIQFLPNG